jgi:hypothetical protein
MEDFQLSPNFSFFEATNSSEHPDLVDANRQDAMQLVDSLKWHYTNIMEKIRAARGIPIIVSSGYRNSALNAAVDGSITSQHMALAALASNPALKSCATDFWFEGRESLEDRNEDVAWLARNAAANGITFSQILLEGSCIHIGGPKGINDGRVQWAEKDPVQPGVWHTKTLKIS